MEDFVALPDLIPRDRLRALSQKSDGPATLHLAQHLGALCLTGGAILWLQATPWVWPLMVVHGVLLVFLFSPLHECVHATAFRTRWKNDRTADLCGFLTVYPRLMYRSYHFAHHRYTQDPERDPELSMKKPTNLREYLAWISGRYYWVGKFGLLFRWAFTGRAKANYIAPQAEKGLVREARLVLSGYAAIAAIGLLTDPLILLKLWVGPALVGQVFLRLYLVTEHTGCASGPNMLENVRTVLAGPFVRWLAWNMPFHTEHHTFPSVPFHALPAVHAEIRDKLVHVSPSHAAFNAELVRGFSRTEAPALN